MNKSSIIIILAFSVTVFAGGPGAEKSSPKKLANIGNTCFMNAALQCLYNMTEFTDAILATPPNFYKPKSIAELYKNLLKELRETNKDVITPTEFCPRIWQEIGQTAGSQGDVKAVVDLLFQHVLKDDLQAPAKPYYAELIEYTIKTTDILNNGEMRSREISSPTFVLSGNNFQASLADITTPRNNPDGSQRIRTFTKTGRYLVCTKAFGKTEPFPFPTKFDLAQNSYNLISCAFHRGSSDQSGHYVAYVKKNNRWFYCSDTTIEEIPESTIVRFSRYGYEKSNLDLPPQLMEKSKSDLPILLMYERQTPIASTSKTLAIP